MSTTTQNGNGQHVARRPVEVVSDKLKSHVELIRQVLPTALKDEAERLVKRALVYFTRTDKLLECTPQSFIQCVIDAAELGLPLDGRLGYAVPYNVKVQKDPDRWEKQAQFQPGYKGLVSVAKRSGQIVGAKADIICANDAFRHGRSGPASVLEHTYQIDKPRGDVTGAYAIIRYGASPDDWEYEVMSFAELEKVRNSSKASGSGPWVDWPEEMRKKTVLKRALKTHCDDPSLLRAIDLDEREFDGEAIGQSADRGGKVRRSTINETLGLPAPSAPFELPTRGEAQDDGEYEYAPRQSGTGGHEHTQHQAEPAAVLFDFSRLASDVQAAKSYADCREIDFQAKVQHKYGRPTEKDEAFIDKALAAREAELPARGERATQAG